MSHAFNDRVDEPWDRNIYPNHFLQNKCLSEKEEKT